MVRPVTLAEIKAEQPLAQLALVRQARLSVVPISAEEWGYILNMGRTAL
jgi:predicted RNA-binding protein with PUA-like domain